MQPEINLHIFEDSENGLVNVDIKSEDGGLACAFIAVSKSKQAACRMAARRLRMIAKQADAIADRIKYASR